MEKEERTPLINFDFHVHTHYSADSAIHPRHIIKVARERGLSGLAITDHNTIRGGLEVAKQNDLDDFFVVVGSEIRTKLCEIIGLFLNEEISTSDPFRVIDEIEGQGGLTVLPHPFRSPLIPNLIAQKKVPISLIRRVDAIEVLNSRTSGVRNERAFLLATKMGKPMIAGSDAHFYPEVGNVRVAIPPFDGMEGLKRRILRGETRIEGKTNSFMSNLYFQFLSFLYSRVEWRR
jgi:predicted metal-dependent phosphoesterase TrpH